MIPPTAAIDDVIMKQASRSRSVLIPARRAASMLPPTAYTQSPNLVRFNTNVHSMSSAPSRTRT